MTGHARSSGYEKVPHEWYCEPRAAVDALLDVEAFDGIVFDPACGSGNIPLACIARGLAAGGSDIVDRGYGAVMDFLSPDDFPADRRIANVLTNPPFGLAEKFIARAVTFATSKIVMFGRLAFLEGQRRRQLFLSTPFARVWVCSSRVSMPPGGTSVPASGGSVAYAWFVWQHGHIGLPTLGWLP